MKKQMILLTVVLAVGMMAGLVYGDGEPTPISYGGSVEENFDSIGATGTTMPAGWMAGGCANAEETDPPIEQFGPESLTVHDGSTQLKGSVLNLGTTDDPDRAVGQSPTSSSNDRGIQVALRNDTGEPLTSITIHYTGEQWRDGQASPTNYSSGLDQEKLKMFVSDTHDFSGWVEDMGSDFFFVRVQNTGGAIGLDGNDPANRTENIGGEYTLTNPIPAGGLFYLSWFDWENNATNDHILAIDDVVIGVAGTAQLVSPIDWAYRDVGLLEWLRPEPTVPGDPAVSVEVRFGTDPNLIVGVNGTTQIASGQIDSSTNIPNPLDAGETYYWIVDVIDPNGGNGGRMIPGARWEFIASVPAEVMLSKTALTVSEEGETSDTYRVTLSRAPAQPVTVTPGFPTVFDLPIVASGDDVEERQSDGDIARSSTDLEMPYDGSTLQITGLWFDNIQIPPGATITSASVDFIADGTVGGAVYLTIAGRLDDPGTFQQDINWMVSTPPITDDETTAEVEWTPMDWTDDLVYSTPPLTTIIQEIVDGSDWSFGRGLAITIRDGNSGGITASGTFRRAESVNGQAGWQPVLNITYAAGTGDWPVSWTPFVVLDGTNWSTGEDITVTAIDDSIIEADPHMFTLPNMVSSADAEWNGVIADDVLVTIVENDCGAWGYHPLDLNDDCVIDIIDLAKLASEFGICTDPHFPGACVTTWKP